MSIGDRQTFSEPPPDDTPHLGCPCLLSKLLPGTVPMTMDPATERDHYLALKLQEQDEERER